jgi:hypothetical protein
MVSELSTVSPSLTRTAPPSPDMVQPPVAATWQRDSRTVRAGPDPVKVLRSTPARAMPDGSAALSDNGIGT